MDGIKLQKQMNGKGFHLLCTVSGDTVRVNNVADDESHTFQCPLVVEPEFDEDIAWDDVDGRELDPKEARKAKQDEIGFYNKMGTKAEVPIEECYENSGKLPILVRWVYHNKGD